MKDANRILRRTGAWVLTVLLACTPIAQHAVPVYADDSVITESNYTLPDPNEGLEEDLKNASDIGSTEPTTEEELAAIDEEAAAAAEASGQTPQLFSINEASERTISSDYETELAKFPKSYQIKLGALHEQYPNWIFVADYVGRDWDEALAAENKSAVSVIQNLSDYTSDLLLSKQKGDYENGQYVIRDGGGWVSCNDLAVAYYLDPRNFLDAKNIFMFETLAYDSSFHTLEGVNDIIDGSFMDKSNITYITTSGSKKTINSTYAQTILHAGKSSGVSPYFLASKIINEVGYSGSKSVTGNYTGYIGYYNFYNIGASDSASGNAIAKGLAYAKGSGSYSRPWNTPVKSITGGALWIADQYIDGGQNTPYYQRFNVAADTDYPYAHQYATCVYYAASTAASTYYAYNKSGTLKSAKLFVIPVFDDMPGETAQSKSVKFSTTPSSQTGTINTSSVSLRDAATTNSNLVTYLPKNTKLTITDKVRTTSTSYSYFNKNPYWYKVNCTVNGKKYSGYVTQKYVTLSTSVSIRPGSTKSVKATSSSSDVTYFSENERIAKISSSGTITGVAVGTTNVIAYTSGGGFDILKVTVSNSAAETSEDVLYNSPKTGVIYNTASVYVRQGPSTDTAIVTTLKKGAEVKVLGENGDFYKVENGYISKTRVKITEETESKDTLYESPKTGKVTVSDSLNIRKTPSITGTVVGSLTSGATVTLLGENGNFYKISNGYVSKDYIKIVTSEDDLYDSPKTGVIYNTASVYVRKGPSTDTDIVTTLLKGAEVKVLGENGDFYKVENGYISKTRVKITETSKDTLYNEAKTGVIVNTSTVNVRKGPSTDTDIVTTLKKGAEVKVLGENGSFYKVSNGYISKTWIQFQSTSETSKDTLYDEAKTGVIANTTTVNVRTGPSTDTDIVTTLKKGAEVKVLGENGSFYKVSNGYISKTWIKFQSTSGTSKDTLYDEAKTGKVTASDSLNVRQTPSTTAAVVGSLSSGATVQLLGENGDFYKISTGYVSKDYIEIVTSGSITGDKLYETSKTGVVVNSSPLNMREGPSTSYDVVKTVKVGTTITVLGENGSFYKTADGYLSKTYVVLKNSGDSIYNYSKNGVVVNSNIYLRTGASTTSSIIKTVTKGTSVKLLGTNGSFYKTADGYLSKNYVVFKNSGDSIYNYSKTGTVKVTSGELNVRESASTNANVVDSLANGEKVKIYGTNGNFYKIENGYVSKDYVVVGTAAAASVAAARSGLLAQIVAPKLFSQAAVNTAETTAETRSSDTLYDKSKTGSVTASVLNVRKGPSTSTNVVSTLKNGTKVTLLGENGNFYKIKNGYISKDYVLLAKSGDSFYTTAKTGVIVNSTVLNIREGASTSTDILGTIKKGTTVKLYGTNGKFYRSDKGYLSKTYVVIKSSGDSIYSTSKTAR